MLNQVTIFIYYAAVFSALRIYSDWHYGTCAKRNLYLLK